MTDKPTRGRPKGKKVSPVEKAQRQMAAMHPRTSKPNPGKVAAEAEANGETLDQATLRLQRARADTEELDRQKRQLELDRARGLLVEKDEAVDLAQAAVLRVCQVLDLLPERLRDRLDPNDHHVCEVVDEVIREARTEVATL